jgi:hypothetical protein
MEDRNLVITASSDGLCKIFETSTLKLLKKLSFKIKEDEKNYAIRGLKYDKNSGFLYTIQAPLRGYTYLTKWDVKNNFNPVKSIDVSDSICTSMDYHPFYDLIGLADCKGSIIYVDASQMFKIKEVPIREITIKSVAFKDSNIISGAADNALAMDYIYKPKLISFTSLFKLLLIVLYGYFIYTKIKENKI